MTNKLLLTLFTLSIFHSIQAQTKTQSASVEKSVFSIQTGFLGLWVNHEAKLTNKIALRTELGLDAGIFAGYNYPKTGFFYGSSPYIRATLVLQH
mgnify:CR=1 FL=1|tara:strand:+ start:4334 stop:4618 length:285 start_codon:yes stop_codon:yes gene_type:complete